MRILVIPSCLDLSALEIVKVTKKWTQLSDWTTITEFIRAFDKFIIIIFASIVIQTTPAYKNCEVTFIGITYALLESVSLWECKMPHRFPLEASKEMFPILMIKCNQP